jgi:hypothetical protein
MMINKLSEIWDMQEFLNNETLKNNGYVLEIGDTKKPLEINDFRTIVAKLGPKACGKSGLVHYWTQQYTLAGLMEVQEFEAELVSDDAVKRQLELIDVLHFILSMYQVTGITKDEFITRAKESVAGIFEAEVGDFGPDSKAYASKMRDSMFGVIKALPWKHWSKKVEFNLDEVRNLIDFTLLVWCRAAHREHLTPDRIHFLYTEKNKVNLARQASGSYSETNKKPDEGHIK